MDAQSADRWRRTARRFEEVAQQLRIAASMVWTSKAGEQLKDTLIAQAGTVIEVATAAREVAELIESFPESDAAGPVKVI